MTITIKGISGDKEEIYTRKALDNNGDMITHLSEESKEIKAGNKQMGEIDLEAINCLNEFYKYAKDKGAKVYLSYPALFDEQYFVWKDDIEQLDKIIAKECNIPLISKPEQYIYSSNEIYDTIYHVNKEGRYKRTMQLIEDLKVSNLK